MNDCTSGKIVEAFDPQPALVVPGPVGDDGVDESGDHDAVDDVRDEVATLGQCPRHLGGSISKHRCYCDLSKKLDLLIDGVFSFKTV